MLAPTGSGKTLAAFLSSIDRIVHSDRPPKSTQVLYISPLKALAYDIERNLHQPLAGISERMPQPPRQVSVAVRTGDTPASERRRQGKHPSDILITTPESLFLLLGSQARENLRSVHTVIVDEIHALAGNKRGAHLAVSLERLCDITHQEPQRIGLSATQRPMEEIARFLGGDRTVEIINASAPPALSLRVDVPVADMTAPTVPTATGEHEPVASIWPALYPRLLELIVAHTATIVFVNNRRLAEVLAQELNAERDPPVARAHHGSVSKRQRKEIEGALKAGTLRCIVSTSSLELGIDMAAVDLVIQIESPGSVARGLQRIGRAGHGVGLRSKGRLFPKFRGDLVEATATALGMKRGHIEATHVPQNPLDVLAQQLVAMCSLGPHTVDTLGRLVRRAYPYRDLSEDALRSVLDMLSGLYPSDEFSELRPRLNWNRATDTLAARPGARMLTTTNAGTIPDRGLYYVHLGEKGPRIGELDEEMVHESRPGETFVLGASTWRIEAITRDRVVVAPAPGEPGKMPFWRGEGPGRPVELGRTMGELLRTIDTLSDTEAKSWLQAQASLTPAAADNLIAYVAAQRNATGSLPTDQAITVERFRDDLGDWRVCLLTPFGRRVHAPWALAIESILGSATGKPVQMVADDDGIVLRIPDTGQRPHANELVISPDDIEGLVIDQLGASSLFAARFREAAARALLLPRRRPGQRTPLWSQRLRAQSLLAVAKRYPSFPIILEAFRECLRDVFDLEALKQILTGIRDGSIRFETVETQSPSPFAQSLAFSYVSTYLYDGDVPVAERRAQALTLDRNMLRKLLGEQSLAKILDTEVVASASDRLPRSVGELASADNLHDLLRRAGDISVSDLTENQHAAAWIGQLERETRAIRVAVAGEPRVIAAQDAARYQQALGIDLPASLPKQFLTPVTEPLVGLVQRWAQHQGPFDDSAVATHFGVTAAQAHQTLAALEASGVLLRDYYRDPQTLQWCHHDVVRYLKRQSLDKLRDQIQPVDAATLTRFLLAYHALGSARRGGAAALHDAIDKLRGIALPLRDLDATILPGRIADYVPRALDELGIAGELVWIGHGSGKTGGKIALYRRDDLPLIPKTQPSEDLPPQPRAVLEHLTRHGACFASDLTTSTGMSLTELTTVLADLAWAGYVTNDTLSPLRVHRKTRTTQGKRTRRPPRTMASLGGRWSIVPYRDTSPTERAHSQALALLDRYGVVTQAAAAAEAVPGGFGPLATVLRAMEDKGEVRRGHFIRDSPGAQFARSDIVNRLRRAKTTDLEACVVVAATDPANPYGSLVPWPKTAMDGTVLQRRANVRVLLHGGTPVAVLEGHRLITFQQIDHERLTVVVQQCATALLQSSGTKRRVRIDSIDGVPVRESSIMDALVAAGFHGEYRSLMLE